jgi:hypothetical protein
MLLCRRHHRLVHEFGYGVDSNGRFYYPWGQPVAEAPPLPRAGPDELLERNRDFGIDSLTCEAGEGAEFDLAAAVDVLLWAERRGPPDLDHSPGMVLPPPRRADLSLRL